MTRSGKSELKHILLIMLDGVGLPPEPLAESIYSECPTLRLLFAEHSVAIDAKLGVAGVPQSATGQTAILTGLNAPRFMRGHREGFPGPALRALVEEENIFKQIRSHGFSATFANAYVTFAKEMPMTYRSVTTVAAFASLPCTRGMANLLEGQAVYHDLTRRMLLKKGHKEVATITEEEAAHHLLQTMRTVDFCLFEFFLTDHAGHRGNLADKLKVLKSLDSFFKTLLSELRRNEELWLTVSDHGNIEAPDIKGHTENPVPFVAVGCGADTALRSVRSLLDVTPFILTLLEKEEDSP